MYAKCDTGGSAVRKPLMTEQQLHRRRRLWPLFALNVPVVLLRSLRDPTGKQQQVCQGAKSTSVKRETSHQSSQRRAASLFGHFCLRRNFYHCLTRMQKQHTHTLQNSLCPTYLPKSHWFFVFFA